MGFSVKEWFENVYEGEVLVAYKGTISSNLITDSLDIVEKKMEDSNENSKIKKKVYNVMVECLQNM